jgi:acyl-CoA reductase-like NAD-dependent aldehyde dehydrogenase
LASAVWSTDNERALDVARRIRAGTVWINDHHMISCDVPFGGYKQSGVGRELGPHALDAYTETKHIHLDLSGRLDRRAYAALLSEPAE